jgi:hypothetical protein
MGNFKLQLILHEELKFRTVKRILLQQTRRNGFWFKFLLNERIYCDDNRISDLPATLEQIEIKEFEIEDKCLMFQSSNSSFKMEFSNDLEFGLIKQN